MAEITVASNPTAEMDLTGSMAGPIWLSPLVGYVFYSRTSTGGFECVKTTDAGATWATSDNAGRPTVANSSSYHRLAAWFDQWTPGNTGTVVHVAMLESSGGVGNKVLRYVAYDTATDEWGTPVDINTTSKTEDTLSSVSITVAVGGNIYVASASATNRAFRRSTNGGATWSSRSAVAETDGNDWLKLFPANLADTNDIWAVFFDASANQLSLKTYDDSGNSWAENTIASSIVENATYPGAVFDAAVRHSDGHLLVAVWTAFDNASADLLTFDITDGSSISGTGNVVTDSDDCGFVTVFIDQQTDDVYVGYFGTEAGTQTAGTSWQSYYKISTDGMATWGSQTSYFSTADDYRYISSGHSVGSDGGWFMPLIFDEDDVLLYVNDANGVEIPEFATTVSSVGAIASAEAVPSPVLKSGVSMAGIASEEAFGTATMRMNVTVEAIASEEAVGEPTVSPIQAVSPTGIVTEEALGTPAVTPDTYTISPGGIASAEAIGEAVIGRAVFPSSISSLEAVGTPALTKYVTFTGIESAEAIGSLQLNRSLILTGIASAEAFGTTVITVGSVTITVSGIDTVEDFGEPIVVAATTSGFRRPPPGSARYQPAPMAGVARVAPRPPAGAGF